MQVLEEYRKNINIAIRKAFGNRIKQNFLIEMMDKVQRDFGPDIFQYYNELLKFDGDVLLKGNQDTLISYEICRNIVGVHRNNTIFVNDSERAKLQNDKEYKDRLSKQVIEQIKLRGYSGKFARTNQFIAGDEFFFFPIPYKLFAICVRSEELLDRHLNIEYFDFFTMIFNKGLSALCLLENNMFDSIYPICRAIIEVYIKMLVFMTNPNCLQDYQCLCSLELEKGCNGEYPKAFNEKFKNRRFQKDKAKLDYLHYGWVDGIKDFDEAVDGNQYSFRALFKYLVSFFKKNGNDETDNFNLLYYLYEFCHSFTHGTSGNKGYPLAHYFNIVQMLDLTVEHSYRILCEQLQVDNKINGINVLDSLRADSELMCKQSKLRSSENFLKYYQTFDCLSNDK